MSGTDSESEFELGFVAGSCRRIDTVKKRIVEEGFEHVRRRLSSAQANLTRRKSDLIEKIRRMSESTQSTKSSGNISAPEEPIFDKKLFMVLEDEVESSDRGNDSSIKLDQVSAVTTTSGYTTGLSKLTDDDEEGSDDVFESPYTSREKFYSDEREVLSIRGEYVGMFRDESTVRDESSDSSESYGFRSLDDIKSSSELFLSAKSSYYSQEMSSSDDEEEHRTVHVRNTINQTKVIKEEKKTPLVINTSLLMSARKEERRRSASLNEDDDGNRFKQLIVINESAPRFVYKDGILCNAMDDRNQVGIRAAVNNIAFDHATQINALSVHAPQSSENSSSLLTTADDDSSIPVKGEAISEASKSVGRLSTTFSTKDYLNTESKSILGEQILKLSAGVDGNVKGAGDLSLGVFTQRGVPTETRNTLLFAFDNSFGKYSRKMNRIESSTDDGMSSMDRVSGSASVPISHPRANKTALKVSASFDPSRLDKRYVSAPAGKKTQHNVEQASDTCSQPILERGHCTSPNFDITRKLGSVPSVPITRANRNNRLKVSKSFDSATPKNKQREASNKLTVSLSIQEHLNFTPNSKTMINPNFSFTEEDLLSLTQDSPCGTSNVNPAPETPTSLSSSSTDTLKASSDESILAYEIARIHAVHEIASVMVEKAILSAIATIAFEARKWEHGIIPYIVVTPPPVDTAPTFQNCFAVSPATTGQKFDTLDVPVSTTVREDSHAVVIVDSQNPEDAAEEEQVISLVPESSPKTTVEKESQTDKSAKEDHVAQDTLTLLAPPVQQRKQDHVSQDTLTLQAPPVQQGKQDHVSQNTLTLQAPPVQREKQDHVSQNSVTLQAPPVQQRKQDHVSQDTHTVQAPPVQQKKKDHASQNSVTLQTPPVQQRNVSHDTHTLLAPPVQRRNNFLCRADEQDSIAVLSNSSSSLLGRKRHPLFITDLIIECTKGPDWEYGDVPSIIVTPPTPHQNKMFHPCGRIGGQLTDSNNMSLVVNLVSVEYNTPSIPIFEHKHIVPVPEGIVHDVFAVPQAESGSSLCSLDELCEMVESVSDSQLEVCLVKYDLETAALAIKDVVPVPGGVQHGVFAVPLRSLGDEYAECEVCVNRFENSSSAPSMEYVRTIAKPQHGIFAVPALHASHAVRDANTQTDNAGTFLGQIATPVPNTPASIYIVTPSELPRGEEGYSFSFPFKPAQQQVESSPAKKEETKMTQPSSRANMALRKYWETRAVTATSPSTTVTSPSTRAVTATSPSTTVTSPSTRAATATSPTTRAATVASPSTRAATVTSPSTQAATATSPSVTNSVATSPTVDNSIPSTATALVDSYEQQSCLSSIPSGGIDERRFMTSGMWKSKSTDTTQSIPSSSSQVSFGSDLDLESDSNQSYYLNPLLFSRGMAATPAADKHSANSLIRDFTRPVKRVSTTTNSARKIQKTDIDEFDMRSLSIKHETKSPTLPSIMLPLTNALSSLMRDYASSHGSDSDNITEVSKNASSPVTVVSNKTSVVTVSRSAPLKDDEVVPETKPPIKCDKATSAPSLKSTSSEFFKMAKKTRREMRKKVSKRQEKLRYLSPLSKTSSQGASVEIKLTMLHKSYRVGSVYRELMASSDSSLQLGPVPRSRRSEKSSSTPSLRSSAHSLERQPSHYSSSLKYGVERRRCRSAPPQPNSVVPARNVVTITRPFQLQGQQSRAAEQLFAQRMKATLAALSPNSRNNDQRFSMYAIDSPKECCPPPPTPVASQRSFTNKLSGEVAVQPRSELVAAETKQENTDELKELGPVHQKYLKTLATATPLMQRVLTTSDWPVIAFLLEEANFAATTPEWFQKMKVQELAATAGQQEEKLPKLSIVEHNTSDEAIQKGHISSSEPERSDFGRQTPRKAKPKPLRSGVAQQTPSKQKYGQRAGQSRPRAKSISSGQGVATPQKTAKERSTSSENVRAQSNSGAPPKRASLTSKSYLASRPGAKTREAARGTISSSEPVSYKSRPIFGNRRRNSNGQKTVPLKERSPSPRTYTQDSRSPKIKEEISNRKDHHPSPRSPQVNSASGISTSSASPQTAPTSPQVFIFPVENKWKLRSMKRKDAQDSLKSPSSHKATQTLVDRAVKERPRPKQTANSRPQYLARERSPRSPTRPKYSTKDRPPRSPTGVDVTSPPGRDSLVHSPPAKPSAQMRPPTLQLSDKNVQPSRAERSPLMRSFSADLNSASERTSQSRFTPSPVSVASSPQTLVKDKSPSAGTILSLSASSPHILASPSVKNESPRTEKIMLSASSPLSALVKVKSSGTGKLSSSASSPHTLKSPSIKDKGLADAERVEKLPTSVSSPHTLASPSVKVKSSGAERTHSYKRSRIPVHKRRLSHGAPVSCPSSTEASSAERLTSHRRRTSAYSYHPHEKSASGEQSWGVSTSQESYVSQERQPLHEKNTSHGRLSSNKRETSHERSKSSERAARSFKYERQDRSPSNDRQQRTPSNERQQRSSSNESPRRSRTVSNERQQRTSSHERQQRSPSDESTRRSRTLSSERQQRIPSNERQQRSSDESPRRSRTLSNERQQRTLSNERQQRSSSDERQQRALLNERQQRSSSDERQQRALSYESHKRSPSDESPGRSRTLSNERQQRSPSNERPGKTHSSDKQQRTPSNERQQRSPSNERPEQTSLDDGQQRTPPQERPALNERPPSRERPPSGRSRKGSTSKPPSGRDAASSRSSLNRGGAVPPPEKELKATRSQQSSTAGDVQRRPVASGSKDEQKSNSKAKSSKESKRNQDKSEPKQEKGLFGKKKQTKSLSSRIRKNENVKKTENLKQHAIAKPVARKEPHKREIKSAAVKEEAKKNLSAKGKEEKEKVPTKKSLAKKQVPSIPPKNQKAANVKNGGDGEAEQAPRQKQIATKPRPKRAAELRMKQKGLNPPTNQQAASKQEATPQSKTGQRKAAKSTTEKKARDVQEQHNKSSSEEITTISSLITDPSASDDIIHAWESPNFAGQSQAAISSVSDSNLACHCHSIREDSLAIEQVQDNSSLIETPIITSGEFEVSSESPTMDFTFPTAELSDIYSEITEGERENDPRLHTRTSSDDIIMISAVISDLSGSSSDMISPPESTSLRPGDEYGYEDSLTARQEARANTSVDNLVGLHSPAVYVGGSLDNGTNIDQPANQEEMTADSSIKNRLIRADRMKRQDSDIGSAVLSAQDSGSLFSPGSSFSMDALSEATSKHSDVGQKSGPLQVQKSGTASVESGAASRASGISLMSSTGSTGSVSKKKTKGLKKLFKKLF